MRRRSLAFVAAVAGIALAAAALHARETTRPLPPLAARELSLQSGALAERLFVRFDALAADVYWMRTIQEYGRERRSSRTTGRFERLNGLLDLTTSLDPHFNLAYRFGAIFLSNDEPDGPGRPDQAIALLEKGLRANPTRWQYAHDIGFVNYWHTGNYAEAARWFDKAAAMPGAPEWLRPLAAITLAQGGDRRGARQILTEIASAPEPSVRRAANRGLQQLEAMDEIDLLEMLVAKYRAAMGHGPATWSDLVGARLLPDLPVDPAGAPYQYDAATGAVTLGPDSALAPLPAGLKRP